MEELGRQAIEIIRKIAKGGCAGIECGSCILGQNYTNLCSDIDNLEGNVEAYEG